MREGEFAGQTAFVTGGSGGIGLACVQALMRRGAVVYVGDLDSQTARQVTKDAGAWFLPVDVRNTSSVEAAIENIAAEHGRLDVAVNCAGMRHAAPGEALPDDEWDLVLDVNAAGVYRSCRAEGRVMLAQGAGSIVNIASMSGHVVNRPQKQVAYNASKAAVHMITKSLAVEWAMRGVRVNSVSPGYVLTAMTAESRKNPDRIEEWMSYTPMRRMAEPAEIAEPVVFLASSGASFITGADLVVDGGYTAV